MQRNILIIAGIAMILELYVYQAVRTFSENTIVRIGYWIVTIATYSFFVYEILHIQRSDKDHHGVQMVASIFLLFIVPKLLIIFFLLIDDTGRIIKYLYTFFAAPDSYFPTRRKFLSNIGLASAALFSLAVLDGIVFGKYRHKARVVKLKLPNLPFSFKGYRIVQISDVHSGSFFHPEKLQKAINLINEQKPDLVLFTGDMVNNLAEEFVPFIPLFRQIKAVDGKFSVLGNHDYGDYVHWNSAEEKAQNIPKLEKYQKEAGFELLKNENRFIEKNGEKLFIIGVENWGEKPFPQFGDLDKAVGNISPDECKILMSHDPTHFDRVVVDHPSNVQLTLSGHTHGMQFGVDLKNIRWSPVQYRYPKWADLYERKEKFLYVNRGFGVLGFPGRVGVLPEITLFELS